MARVVIFYWEPGSCGDFINSLLMLQPTEYQGVLEENFVHTDQGRVRTKISNFFVENFDHTPMQWLLRTWSVKDCELLSKFINTLDCNSFVIPTHRLDQTDFLQSQFSNSITLGITYPKNMFPLVLKNWCKKVVPTDVAIREIYNQPLPNYLKNKNSFGEFVLSEQLKYGTRLRSVVDKNFDHPISLEDIYNNDLSAVKSLLQDHKHVEQHYNVWIQKQNYMHSYQYNLPSILNQALGYNSKSTRPGNLNCNLDIFDNISITHYCNTHILLTQIPRFNTLQQALNFFKDHAEIDNYTR